MAEPSKDVRAELAAIDDRITEDLKPFQRATSEHIAHLFKTKKRVLLADEVGLGKTLVARSVIAKVARLRSLEGDDLVKVVYVCSNGSIASQNVQKLRIDSDVELAAPDDSRLSMQHLRLALEHCDSDLKRRYVQITPLTPGTSFQLAVGTGTLRERALIYAALSWAEEFSGNSKRRSRLRRLLWARASGSRAENWDNPCNEMLERVSQAHKGVAALDDGTSYPADLLTTVRSELSGEKVSMDELVRYLDEQGPDSDRSFERAAIASLRRAFSKASMDMMEPDLVIMDEFQRFRDLVSDDDTETSLLAHRFLQGNTRVLLLSATPFRMYTTAREDDDEQFGDSAHEFHQLVEFLTGDDADLQTNFDEVWREYGYSLVSAALGDSTAIVACQKEKDAVESSMLDFMTRTERTSTDEISSLMHANISPKPLTVTEEDIETYFAMNDIGSAAGVQSGLLNTDYAKSCPFPLSFMRSYEFTRQLEHGARNAWSDVDKVAKREWKRLWINRDRMAAYKPLEVPHARYQQLRNDIFDCSEAERLLWVPPSMPYYRPNASSPFTKSEGFTKTLVFSSWAMVPPALATLLSYEAEQKNVASLMRRGQDYRYFRDGDDEDADTHLTPRSRLHLAGSRPDSFVLAYPSIYLANVVSFGSAHDTIPELNQLRVRIAKTIRRDLCEALGVGRLPSGTSRSSLAWYAFAELLLDAYSTGSRNWSRQLVADAGMRKRYPSALRNVERYIDEFDYWEPKARLSEFPDDLVDVLADAAIGSPAVCALRAYAVEGNLAKVGPALPFEFGYSFITKLNSPDATTCIAAVTERGNYADSASAHWKHALGYCCEGNFQAMLDEYFHMVYDGSVERAHRAIVGEKLGNDKTPSLHKVEGLYEASTYSIFKQEVLGKGKRRASAARLHTNFAAGFMESHGKDGKQEIRRSEIRAAFNSPFRPFVLISTSVGQEGLDFHQYCRRIVHWNLPTNPIDFEQREGRVNRYKSLAVRQTLAKRYGKFVTFGSNAWDKLFVIAEEQENEGRNPSGLLPYWGVRDGEDKVPIERLVYNYPFSKDVGLYDYLLRTMAEYRAVMGQPNQDELLGLLHKRLGDPSAPIDNLEGIFLNLCPFCHQTLHSDPSSGQV